MKKIKQTIMLSFFSIVFLSLAPMTGVTEGIAGNGGGIQTTGEIGFYEETRGTTEPSASGGKQLPNTKPVGRFPSTGELIKQSLLIVGAILIIAGLLFLFLKQKKKEGEKKERR